MIDNIDFLNTAFITMILIVLTTMVLYKIMGKMNKPIVLGGLIAGMILCNLHLPTAIFNLNSCSILGEFGIVIFMMITGVKFKTTTFTQNKSNLLIIAISAVFTFLGGFLCAKYLYHLNANSASHISEFYFAVLLSVSLSTPAFTLVSLFINQTHLLKLHVSQLALLLSFCEDLIFWLIISLILIATQTNGIIQINETLLIIVYLFGSFLIGKPIITWIVNKIHVNSLMLLFLFIGTCIFAVIADSVDLHQILGAFIFGMLLPKDNKIINKIIVPIEKLSNTFLLPIFFAQIGGLAHLANVTNASLILISIALALVALFSKFTGAYIGAKLLKYSNLEAGFLGGLLNLRGVFEVVFIKISWEIGLISKEIFIVLVIMSISSTWFSSAISLWFRNQILQKNYLIKQLSGN